MKQGSFFGPYEIIEKVTEGAFSEIFKIKKDREVFALKKLKPYMMFDREYIPLIKTEALLLSRIDDHANFPILIDQGEIHHEHFSVIEFIEGLNLEQMITISFAQNQPLPLFLVCQIVLEISRGLEHLHKVDLKANTPTVHGDLRASNVMISEKGEVKLIDLGLKGGTFDYMPLERIDKKALTPYTDIYAVGHILYELTHGKRLYQAKTKMEAYSQMRQIEITEKFFHTIESEEVRRILTKSLRQEQSFHYTNAVELRRDLENYFRTQNRSPDRPVLGNTVRKLKKFLIHP